nr:reverse transcriptase domain-containing protein [Tanacetum cinerariifolium]
MERHEEILNHLDELSENLEDNIEGLGKGRVIIQHDFDNLKTELQETRAQVAKLQRKQLGQNNKISLALFRINDLEQIVKEIQARHQVDKNASQKDINICSTGHDSGCHQATSLKRAVGLIRWFEHNKSVFSRSNCTEDCKVKFATDSEKIMEAFIGGLPQSIEGNVTASKP